MSWNSALPSRDKKHAEASSQEAPRGNPRSSGAPAGIDQKTDAERQGRCMTAKNTPEVSDVLTEMPRWAARGLLYLIVAFVAVALVWAHFSLVDVTVTARGVLAAGGAE